MTERFRAAPGSRDLRVWLATFVVVLVIGSCWALASPRYAGPDEPAHTVRAYSVAHGEIIGDDREAEGQPGTVVETPVIFVETNPACYAFQPMATGDCLVVVDDERVIESSTSAGRHPPLYYGVVGLPTVLDTSGSSFFVMRGWNAAICAAVLASAMVTARRRPWSSWVPVGIVVACTPMVFFLFGLVNPNALEVAAAIGAWVGGLALIGEEEEVDRRVLLRFAVAVVLLALTRQLGPLWVGLLGVSLAVLAGWGGLKRLAADGAVRAGVAVGAVAGLAAVAWVVVVKPLDTSSSGVPPLTLPQSDIQRALVGEVGLLFREWVGVFGWQDTRVPEAVYFLWAIAFAAMVLAVLAGPLRRVSLVVLALTVLPAALQYPGVREADLFWQGRYTLPLVVGIPLVAAYGLARSPRPVVAPRSLAVPLLGVGLFVAHLLAFGQNLRRYTVGADGTVWFFTAERWSPPLPSGLLLSVYAVAIAAWLAIGRPRRQDPVVVPGDRAAATGLDPAPGPGAETEVSAGASPPTPPGRR
jgi:hypothetical protein